MSRPEDSVPPEQDPQRPTPDEGLPPNVSDDDLFDTFRLPGEAPRPGQDAGEQEEASGHPDDGAAPGQGVSPEPAGGIHGVGHDSPGHMDAADDGADDATLGAGTGSAGAEDAAASEAGGPTAAAAGGEGRGRGEGRRRDEELYAPGEEPREVDPDDAGWSLLGDDGDEGADRDPDEEDPVAAERRRRRRFRQIRGILIIGLLVLVLGSIVSKVIGGLLPGDAADYSKTSGDEVSFTVKGGEGAILIGRRLEEAGIVASAEAFQQAAEMSPGKHIQAGEYELQERMTAADAVKALQGAGRAAVAYVVVNRGERLSEVLDSLAASTPHDRAEFAEVVKDPTKFGLPKKAKTVEGYLAAGEYRLPVKDSAEEMVRAMIEPTFAELEKMGVTDPDEQFRTVTIASIVEAEALPDDYAMVAGIIENRLKPDNRETHGLLQIDATVIYGLGERRLQFSSAERRDESNEYNTYVHKGLTPGPIGAPSTKAIDAAAKPQDNDYYYWVTVDISTGETKFAKTYKEHQKYQNEYRAYCRENPDIC